MLWMVNVFPTYSPCIICCSSCHVLIFPDPWTATWRILYVWICSYIFVVPTVHDCRRKSLFVYFCLFSILENICTFPMAGQTRPSNYSNYTQRDPRFWCCLSNVVGILSVWPLPAYISSLLGFALIPHAVSTQRQTFSNILPLSTQSWCTWSTFYAWGGRPTTELFSHKQ